MASSMEGVNYLDDLLNEMIKDEEPASTLRRQSTQRGVDARPESFRGDFDYLEALLSDIGTSDSPSARSSVKNNSSTPQQETKRNSAGSRGSRGSRDSSEFDLEGTLKDLEDTFSGQTTLEDFIKPAAPKHNNKAQPPASPAHEPTKRRDSPPSSLRTPLPVKQNTPSPQRQTPQRQTPQRTPQSPPKQQRDDYLSVLDELSELAEQAPSPQKPTPQRAAPSPQKPPPQRVSPPPQRAPPSPQKPPAQRVSPPPQKPPPQRTTPSPEDLLDQMISSFSTDNSVDLSRRTSPPTTYRIVSSSSSEDSETEEDLDMKHLQQQKKQQQQQLFELQQQEQEEQQLLQQQQLRKQELLEVQEQQRRLEEQEQQRRLEEQEHQRRLEEQELQRRLEEQEHQRRLEDLEHQRLLAEHEQEQQQRLLEEQEQRQRLLEEQQQQQQRKQQQKQQKQQQQLLEEQRQQQLFEELQQEQLRKQQQLEEQQQRQQQLEEQQQQQWKQQQLIEEQQQQQQQQQERLSPTPSSSSRLYGQPSFPPKSTTLSQSPNPLGRVSQRNIPASAAAAAPLPAPALRTTSTVVQTADPTPPSNNMDDLLEQMINSFVEEEKQHSRPQSTVIPPKHIQSINRQSVVQQQQQQQQPQQQQPVAAAAAQNTNNSRFSSQPNQYNNRQSGVVAAAQTQNTNNGNGSRFMSQPNQFNSPNNRQPVAAGINRQQPTKVQQQQQQLRQQQFSDPQTEDSLLDQILSDAELDPTLVRRTAQDEPLWVAPFDQLDLREKLGVGPHGESYRGTIFNNKRATVKKLNCNTGLTPAITQEIDHLVSLQHENLVPLLGACGENGLYLIWEYVAGANLHGFVRSGGLGGGADVVPAIIRIARAISATMAFLHNNGITHRSLSPKNVFLDSEMRVRVKDYGLAGVKDEIQRFQRATSNQRASGFFSQQDAQYSAPELLRSGAYDAKVDVYSFAVMLWELFSGESMKPGTAGSFQDLSNCPFAIQKLIRVCGAPDPGARPSFDTVVKIFNQPLEVLLRYARTDTGVPDPTASRPTTTTQIQRPGFGAAAEVDDDEAQKQREKLQQVLAVVGDLIRTPSDAAQMKAVGALENLAQKDSNIVEMAAWGFVPTVVDLLRSRFVPVQEHAARVVAALLKNVQFATAFAEARGIESILVLLTNSDEALRLVAAKALTMAAYTAPAVTRGAVHAKSGHSLLVSLLSSENEFVQVQTAWALSAILTDDEGDAMTKTYISKGGVAPLERMFLTSSSPAALLRSLAALVPLYGREEVRRGAANQVALVKKVASMMSSPQQPLKAQALHAAARLSAHPTCQDILVTQGVLSSVSSFLSSPVPQLVAAALDMLLLLVDSPTHSAELQRIGLREALIRHLESEDAGVQDLARTLYNLLA